MAWEGWFTLAVVLLALVAMMREFAGPDLIMMAALFTIAAAGILTPEETFLGFANPALAAVGALFVVSAGLRETGALEMTVGRLFEPGARREERPRAHLPAGRRALGLPQQRAHRGDDDAHHHRLGAPPRACRRAAS